MEPSFFLSRSPDDEPTLNLLNEALTSSAPPLLKRAVEVIETIKQQTIEQFEGTDRMTAMQFFDALDSLPPVEGFRSYEFINSLHEKDFDLDLMLEDLDARIEQAEREGVPDQEEDDGLDEFGYAHTTAEFKPVATPENQAAPEPSVVPLALDEYASKRDAEEVNLELISLLTETDNRELRGSLIKAFGQIVRWRTFLDLGVGKPPEDSSAS